MAVIPFRGGQRPLEQFLADFGLHLTVKERESASERGREECRLWEGKEVGVNVRKEKHSQFL